MATFKDRLQEALDERNMRPAELARLTQIGEGAISQYRKGEYKASQRNLEKIAKALNVSIAWLMGADEAQDGSGITARPTMIFRPRIGTIACGEPILAEQNFDGYDAVPDFVNCDFTLVCKGDSMTGARICDGDIVCIKQQPEVENGQIAAVQIGEDSATLKRIRYLPGGVALWPENPAYAPMIFTGEDVSKIRILGLATHFISRVI